MRTLVRSERKINFRLKNWKYITYLWPILTNVLWLKDMNCYIVFLRNPLQIEPFTLFPRFRNLWYLLFPVLKISWNNKDLVTSLTSALKNRFHYWNGFQKRSFYVPKITGLIMTWTPRTLATSIRRSVYVLRFSIYLILYYGQQGWWCVCLFKSLFDNFFPAYIHFCSTPSSYFVHRHEWRWEANVD